MDPSEQRSGGTSWWFLLHTKVYRYRALLRKFWWVIVLTTLIGFVVSIWKVHTTPDVYVSTAKLMVVGRVAGMDSGFAEEMSNFFGNQVQMLLSAAVRTRAENRIKAVDPSVVIPYVAIEASPVPSAAMLALRATGPEAAITRTVLDAVMAEFIAFKREMRSDKSEQVLSALTDQISRLEKEVVEGEQALIEFQKKNNIVSLKEEGNSAAAYLASLNRKLADLKTEFGLIERLDLEQNLDRAQSRGARVENSGGDSKAATTEPVSGLSSQGDYGLEYFRSRQAIEVLKAERAEYARDLKPKHPIIVDLDQRIAQQERLIATFRQQSEQQLLQRRKTYEAEIANLESVVGEWEAKALNLSQRIAEYENLKSRVERKRSTWDRLLAHFENLDVGRNVDQEIITVMQDASPAVATRPGTFKIVATGTLLGLMAGALLILLFDQFDDRVASFAEFQWRFKERVLAQIPKEKGFRGSRPLVIDDPRHVFAESLRSLRSSILFMPFEGEPPKTFLVTSAVPGEGKSTVSANFAITLALARSKVLLIDGDLRRGQVHEMFGLENEVGLCDHLRGEAGLDAIIHPTFVEGLDVITRGRSGTNTGELLLSKATDAFLQSIYDRYDYVVFDSSPVMAADDTPSVAPKLDATVFVFRFTYSSSRVSRKAIELLRDRQANVLGAVCNDLDEAMQEYYYYRYAEYASESAAAEKG